MFVPWAFCALDVRGEKQWSVTLNRWASTSPLLSLTGKTLWRGIAPEKWDSGRITNNWSCALVVSHLNCFFLVVFSTVVYGTFRLGRRGVFSIRRVLGALSTATQVSISHKQIGIVSAPVKKAHFSCSVPSQTPQALTHTHNLLPLLVRFSSAALCGSVRNDT